MNRKLLLYTLGGIAIAGCEIPGTPDFKTEHRVSTPLLVERTYELIGGKNSFLDTTSTKMDSLFTIAPDGLISIAQEFDMKLGDLDNAIPALNIDPTTFQSTIGVISVDDFSASFGSKVGVLKQNAQETGQVNIGFGDLSGPIPFPISLTPPVTPALTIANSSFNYAELENGPDNPEVNYLVLSFVNNTSVPLTNSDRTGLPSITLRNSENEALGGENIAFAIDGSPSATSLQPGQTGTARLNLRGSRLTSGLSYTLSLGTTGGNFTSGGSVGLKAITTELRFVEASTNVDAQGGINLDSRATLEGDFVNAVIDDGYLEITIQNNTAMNMVLNTLRIRNANDFVAKGSGQLIKAGSIVIEEVNVSIGARSSRLLDFPLDGKAIGNDLLVEVDAQTSGTGGAVTVNANDEFRYSIRGGLSVRSASARLSPQIFSSSQSFDFANPEFNFASNNDYVQLKSGAILIDDLTNGIDLALDTLQISFPGILVPKTPGVYTAADSLVILFAGANKIARKRDGTPIDRVISLAGAQIRATNNVVRFNIFGKSEDTKSIIGPDSIRTVYSTDFVAATVSVRNLEIERAIGSISTKTFIVGDDVGNDGVLDLFNASEAQITEIDALDVLSENVDDIIFNDPKFTLFLSHNIGVDANIYLAILGRDKKGTEVYLSGKTGSQFEVLPTDVVTGLKARGTDIPKEKLLKFRLADLQNIDQNKLDLVFPFNKNTTTVSEFLSNLPSEIRVVAKAVLNPDGGTGFIKQPLTFTSRMGIEMPVNFATSAGPIKVEDTVKVSLSSLPGDDDDTKLEEGTLFVGYKNGLPMQIEVRLSFLDANRNVITVAPDPTLGANAMTFLSGTIDPNTRFVAAPGEGVFTLGLTSAQLAIINKAEYIAFTAQMNTTANEEIKLRASDYLRIKVSANFKVGTKVTF
jgi:hypothetical protein